MTDELKQRVEAELFSLDYLSVDWAGVDKDDFFDARDLIADLWAKVQEQAADIARLKSARHYAGANPDECVEPDDWPCVSHMAYETLRRTVEAAGWRFNDETDKWEPEQ